jgi:hypothetical protein
MKTLIHPEQLAEWKKAADCAANRPDHMNHVALGVMAAEAIPALIADLEDANASLEAEELMSKTLRHHLMSREAELSGVRKQLSEVQSSKAQWKANHDNVVRKLRLFAQREDLPVDRLPAYEYVRELEKKLAGDEQPSELELHRADYQACKDAGWESPGELLSAYKTLEKQLAEAQLKLDDRNSKIFDLCGDIYSDEFPGLDAAIVEAINDEKLNPWKRAIIEGLIVNHILHTDHETAPVKALAALIDWECKTALDPAVSKEAQELIEKYRKDAERLDYLQAFARCDPKMDGEHVWWSIHPRPTLRGNTLRAAIDAAIAAKGETE